MPVKLPNALNETEGKILFNCVIKYCRAARAVLPTAPQTPFHLLRYFLGCFWPRRENKEKI